jgi:predicted SAM-dependent methyltransferase
MIFHPRRRIEPHLLSALEALRFELAALRGRLLSPKRFSTFGKKYLQLGSGDYRAESFLNSDYFLSGKAELGIDVRFPLPFADESWNGIYAHHLVEHVSYDDAYKLFRECYRVLKLGGIFRMVVPDLEVFLKLYVNPDPHARRTIFSLYPEHIMETLSVRTPLEMIDYIFRDNKHNRHLSAWDWETAKARLEAAGFSRVHRSSVNQSSDEMLLGHDKSHWSGFSLYVEAKK